MGRASIHLFILVAVTAIVMFTNLGSARLWDRDEPRNAGCALEMMQRGDLVVPIFNNELRHQKPVLVYWLIISAYKIFGVGEFAARFWSAVLAVGSVLATWAIGRRLLGPQAALFSGIALATSMMFVVAGRAATPDSLLIFCSTMAMMFHVLGTFAPVKDGSADQGPVLRRAGCWFPADYRYVVAMYVMMGLGVLAKGPVGFVLPCAIIGMFMLIMRLPASDAEMWQRQGWLTRISLALLRPFAPPHFLTTLWRMRPLSLIAIVCLVAAPWYVLVGLQTNGEWPRVFLLSENFGRATTTLESHSGGIWFYPVTIIIGFFPASVFLGPMILKLDRRISGRHPQSAAYVYLICWVAVQVCLFSLAQTKLPNYITPCFPALALLTGAFLSSQSSRRFSAVSWLDRWPSIGLLLTGIGVTIAMPILGQRFLQGDKALAVIGLVLAMGAAWMVWNAANGRLAAANRVFCLTAVVFATGVFGFGTVVVDRHRNTDRILDRIAARSPDVGVASFDRLESSWVFYGRSPVVELSRENPGGTWQNTRQHAWQKRGWPSPEQFVRSYPSALIITTGERLPELLKRLPKRFQVIERADYFLQGDDLVLVGPADVPTHNRDSVRTANAGDDAGLESKGTVRR